MLAIKKTNLQIMDIVNRDTLKKIITKLYYKATSCPDCVSLMQKQKKRPYPLLINYSASRTRTYDIMINSHALLPTELWRNKAKRLPYLTGGNSQLLPAF